MNYDLALELKNAGFPFKHDIDFCVQNGCQFEDRPDPEVYAITHVPTLEELIEWCGDEFESLVRVKDGVLDAEWRAYMTEDAFQRIGENCVRDCCGYEAEDTPKEAVARLGLAIHKKDGKETEKNE